jgi:hypothetical protein
VSVSTRWPTNPEAVITFSENVCHTGALLRVAARKDAAALQTVSGIAVLCNPLWRVVVY